MLPLHLPGQPSQDHEFCPAELLLTPPTTFQAVVCASLSSFHPPGSELNFWCGGGREWSLCLGPWQAHGASCPLAVTRSPPQWEIGIYVAGALVLLGVAAVNLWKLWRSGSYPAPSPFPNYDYRYLQQKYGAAYSDVKHKVQRGEFGSSLSPLQPLGC